MHSDSSHPTPPVTYAEIDAGDTRTREILLLRLEILSLGVCSPAFFGTVASMDSFGGDRSWIRWAYLASLYAPLVSAVIPLSRRSAMLTSATLIAAPLVALSIVLAIQQGVQLAAQPLLFVVLFGSLLLVLAASVSSRLLRLWRARNGAHPAQEVQWIRRAAKAAYWRIRSLLAVVVSDRDFVRLSGSSLYFTGLVMIWGSLALVAAISEGIVSQQMEHLGIPEPWRVSWITVATLIPATLAVLCAVLSIPGLLGLPIGWLVNVNPIMPDLLRIIVGLIVSGAGRFTLNMPVQKLPFRETTPFGLFLRSFADDQGAESSITGGFCLGWIGRRKEALERAISRALLASQPILAVNQPGRELGERDAIRLDLPLKSWQPAVRDLLSRAERTTLILGSSAGAVWELDELLDRHVGKDALVIVPPGRDRLAACMGALVDRLQRESEEQLLGDRIERALVLGLQDGCLRVVVVAGETTSEAYEAAVHRALELIGSRRR